MLFKTDDPQKNGAKVQAQLKKELGLNEDIPFKVIEGDDYQPTHGITLKKAFSNMLQGGPQHLYTLGFSVPGSKPMEVLAFVSRSRQSFVLISKLLFSAPLHKTPSGVAGCESTGKVKFSGDQALASKLNGDKALLKKLTTFSRTQIKFGESVLSTARFVAVAPNESGGVFTASSMPKLTWFGIKVSLESAVFLELAEMIEKDL